LAAHPRIRVRPGLEWLAEVELLGRERVRRPADVYGVGRRGRPSSAAASVEPEAGAFPSGARSC